MKSRKSTPFTTKEVRVQCVREVPVSDRVNAPEDAFKYWKNVVSSAAWFDPEREMIVAVCLNTKLAPTHFTLVSLGTLNESICHPRDVFRAAIVHNAHSVLVLHNHPSGDVTPSEADRRTARRLKDCGGILDMALLDFIIVASGPTLGTDLPERPSYFSFKQCGLL